MATTYRTRVLSSSSLDGNDVRNPQGEDLGHIKDFMIDLDTGAIAYAVLSFGGFLGMGDKLFAIPFESLRVDTENKCFVLDVSKEQLKNAPGFDDDNWPSHADNTFLDKVYTHYGYDSYDSYRTNSYGGYYERRRRAEEGTTMDVVDADRNGV